MSAPLCSARNVGYNGDMPHFGLMDADALGPERAALMRARLHIRGGRRRLRQNKTGYGILTLADALTHAMQWHLESPSRRAKLDIPEGADLNDDQVVYDILTRAGVLDGRFDLGAFDRLVERALEEDVEGVNHATVLRDLEEVMTQLGVMPFDEGELPPEDPATF